MGAAAAATPATLPWLEAALAFIAAVALLHLYLDMRQLRAIHKPRPPPALAKLFTLAEYKKAQAYSVDKWWLRTWRALFSLAENIAVLWLAALPALWRAIGALAPTVAAHGEVAHTVVFVLVVSLYGLISDLPWSIYSTFVVEQRHGFNKMTPKLFLTDTLKSLALGALLLPPITAGFTLLLQRAGPWAPIQLWAFLLALSLLLMAAYPILIAPLFNKFEPLPEGELKSAIDALAGRLAFPLRRLYTIDGSKRSAHSNAYMYGFWKSKRIVLYDTLVSHCTTPQVVAVLAHELGHWKLWHTPALFVLGQLTLLSQLCLFAALRTVCASRGIFEAFGWHDERPALVAFLLFQYLSAPLDEVVSCVVNIISRRFEFQADGFAVSLGHGQQLRQALLALERENKATMNTDPLYSAYHYSHPPLAERLAALDAALAEEKAKVQ